MVGHCYLVRVGVGFKLACHHRPSTHPFDILLREEERAPVRVGHKRFIAINFPKPRHVGNLPFFIGLPGSKREVVSYNSVWKV